MAATLALTPDTETASVLVRVATDETATLYRADQNGTVPVRLQQGQGVESGVLQVRDYEAALVGAVTYTYGSDTASTSLASVRSDWVSVVSQPQFSARARVTLSQSFARPTRSVRHDVIGRPDPVFTLRRGAFRTGTVRAVVTGLEGYDAFDSIQQQAAVVLFRFAAHQRGGRAAVDFYAVVEDLSSDTADGVRALDLTLRVSEVRRPTGYLLGALGWTYGDLAGMGLTYGAVPDTFGTYADLAIGQEAS